VAGARVVAAPDSGFFYVDDSYPAWGEALAWIAAAGYLELVVANAGISGGTGNGRPESEAQARAIFDVNLGGVLLAENKRSAAAVVKRAARAAKEVMGREGGGRWGGGLDRGQW
jgi:hypothetical protein